MDHKIAALALEDIRRWKSHEVHTWEGKTSYRKVIDFYKRAMDDERTFIQAVIRYRLRHLGIQL